VVTTLRQSLLLIRSPEADFPEMKEEKHPWCRHPKMGLIEMLRRLRLADRRRKAQQS